MQQIIINNDLLGEEQLYYFQDNHDWYFCKFFAFREEYCFIEDDNTSIKEEFACIKEIGYLPYEYQCACSISFKTIKGEKFAILEYSNVKYKIPYIFYKNVIEALYCDVYAYNDSKSNINDNRLMFFDNNVFIGWLEPSAFEVYNADTYIEEDIKPIPIPKEIKENFIFDYAQSFFVLYNNNALVKFGQYCGELNEKGELINKFLCNHLSCYEKYNIITINNRQAVIDKNGNFIIKPIYDEVWPIEENLWIVAKDNKYGIIDNDNNVIFELKYDSIKKLYDDNENFIIEKEGKFGIVDIQENIIIPLIYDELKLDYDNDNELFAVKNCKQGKIDTDNNIIIPFEYEELYSLTKDNLCAKASENKFMIINSKNEQICKTIFSYINPYCFNKDEDMQLYPAKIDDLYGFIDEFGNIKIDFKYLSVCTFNNGYCIVETQRNERHLIDINDKIIISNFGYDNFISAIDQDRIIVGNYNNGMGIIDSNKNIITDLIFDYIDFYPFANEKHFRAKCNNKYGFIDIDGKPLKIDKESLKIPETKLDMLQMSTLEQMTHLFS